MDVNEIYVTCAGAQVHASSRRVSLKTLTEFDLFNFN